MLALFEQALKFVSLLQPSIRSVVFFSYHSGLSKQMHSQPNVMTLQSITSVRGDIKSQCCFFNTGGMTSITNKVEILLWQMTIINFLQTLMIHARFWNSDKVTSFCTVFGL